MASSQMSTSVVMRPRPAPRKPRPLSIAGTIPDKALQSRQSRLQEKGASGLSERNSRSKTSGAEGSAAPPEVPPKPAHLRKPHKPQPPASSPLRREQRTPSSKAPREPAKDSSSAPAPVASNTPAAPVAMVAPVPVATVAPTKPSLPEPPVIEDVEKVPVIEVEKLIQVPQSADSVDPTTLSAKPEQEVSAEPEVNTAVQEGKGGEVVSKPIARPVPTEGPAEENATPGKTPSRVISEEEARALLAEKRRLAREQAEREAEQERLRQEELKRQEEERLRLEEEEQRRFEEEQIRLAEEFRRQEEEKLRKAIEEQEKREAEEKQRMELEQQQKVEREEQERKAREEAEKQRKELEERLKREEAERAERKKRVEEIMSRTRRRGGKEPGSPAPGRVGDGAQDSSEENGSSARQQGSSQLSPERESSLPSSGRTSPQTLAKPVEASPQDTGSVPSMPVTGSASSLPVTGHEASPPSEAAATNAACQEEQPKGHVGSEVVLEKLAAGPPDSSVNVREQIGGVGSSADSLRKSEGSDNGGIVTGVPMDQSPPSTFSPSPEELRHTNGYGSHHGSGGNIVNGVGSGKVADLLDLDSLMTSVPLKPEAMHSSTVSDHSVENLRNAGDVNSNRIVPGNQLIEFEEDNRNNKTQGIQFTDLLS